MSNPDNSLRYRLRLIWAYKDVLRNHFPPVFRWYVRRFRAAQLKAARRLRDKERIEVAFFLTIPGMWKSDYLFEALRQHPRYHPYVVIYPYSYYKGFNASEVEATLKRTERFIADKGFEYVIPYDEKRRRWQPVRKTLHPDIVVFTTPYKDIPSKYFIYAFRDVLTCYVPYGFTSLRMFHVNYDLIFHNLVGLHFVETEIHRRQAEDCSRNHGENVVVSGYPGTEVFLRPDYTPRDVWKPQPHRKKRLIWAPHHSLEGNPALSTFLLYCDRMPEWAARYKDDIQLVFKPHPLLKFKLQQLWGAERTEAYYRQWDAMENAQLEESSYVDLFLTSDAMIHDCGSFTTEYLFVNKPVMYLVKDEEFASCFCPFGLMSFQKHYIGRSEADVTHFMEEVLIQGKDVMAEERRRFFEEYLAPREGKLPSERIIQLLEEFQNK
ncbi:MAG: CDP-glycerol glycerophosphotransferase family protein [Bacteroidales bacterium]|nr:CDP-glycerol glycerophosphotransferase family protein [Bacteroidales bacterium]